MANCSGGNLAGETSTSICCFSISATSRRALLRASASIAWSTTKSSSAVNGASSPGERSIQRVIIAADGATSRPQCNCRRDRLDHPGKNVGVAQLIGALGHRGEHLLHGVARPVAPVAAKNQVDADDVAGIV